MSDEGPFQGIVVLEIGQYVSVPYCAELLADGGAEVIKVEPISGDETRKNSEIVPGEGRQYIIKSRGKRGIPIDLASEAGQKIARRLALKCDVLLSNMRPGAIEKLNLAYEQLSPVHERLIFGEISAFGRLGPQANRPGIDVIVQAASGLTLSGRGWEGGVPVWSEAFLTDYMAGMTLAFGIAVALRERDRTGRGQKVTTSLLQAALALQTATANVVEAVDEWKHDFVADLGEHGLSFESFQERRSRMPGNQWFANTYATRDGFVSVGAPGRLRGRFAAILGIEDLTGANGQLALADDPRSVIADLTARAREAVSQFSTQEMVERCDAAGVPCAPVAFVEEVLLGDQASANAFVATFDHPAVGPITMPTVPVNFSRSHFEAAQASPAYGEHTREILSGLGCTEPEIRGLIEERIVGTPETSPFVGG